jgi:cytochrome c2
MPAHDVNWTRTAARIVPALALGLGLAGCGGGGADSQHALVMGGDEERGAVAIRSYGCGACHTIPGISGARGMVGPPLTSWSRRVYIAGKLPNSPDNLIRWVMDAHSVEPGTAMPDLGVTEQQARDIAAYLYTLR